MQKVFAVAIVLSLVIIGVGFSRGWFALSSPSPNGESNKVNISLTVDPDKVKEDAETLKEKAAELTGKATDRTSESRDQEAPKDNN